MWITDMLWATTSCSSGAIRVRSSARPEGGDVREPGLGQRVVEPAEPGGHVAQVPLRRDGVDQQVDLRARRSAPRVRLDVADPFGELRAAEQAVASRPLAGRGPASPAPASWP
jgi:hypothetical protein